jgi:hypothetical protein
MFIEEVKKYEGNFYFLWRSKESVRIWSTQESLTSWILDMTSFSRWKIFLLQWWIQDFGKSGAIIGKKHILLLIQGNVNSFFVRFCYEKSEHFLEPEGGGAVTVLAVTYVLSLFCRALYRVHHYSLSFFFLSLSLFITLTPLLDYHYQSPIYSLLHTSLWSSSSSCSSYYHLPPYCGTWDSI